MARLVMDRTPSMMIAGAAADRLAATHGLEEGAARPLRSRGLVRVESPGRKRAHCAEPGLRPHDRGRDAPGPSSPRALGRPPPDSEDR